MSVRVRVLSALMGVFAVWGCVERPLSTVQVADSAGVVVVTNLEGSVEAAAPWSVAEDPILEIGGGSDPDVPLYRISAITPLESGDVAVGTTVPPQILVFDPRGQLRSTMGRQGDGPGEFLDLGSVVALPPDSIGAWDPDRRRLSIFTEQGALAREVDLSTVAPMSARASGSAENPSGFTHVLPSLAGSLVVFGEAGLGPSSEGVISRHEMPAFRITLAGNVLAEYGPFPGLQTSPGLPSPFGARTHAGSVAGALVVGTSEEPEFRTFGPDGELMQVSRWPDRDRSISGPFLDRWLELVEAEPSLRDYVLEAPRPDVFPAYDDILVAADGSILVAEYPGPLGLLSLRRGDPAPEPLKPTIRMPSRRWLVFSPNGALGATLSTPEGFEPYALVDGLLWGVYTDELDVESVRAYEVDTSP